MMWLFLPSAALAHLHLAARCEDVPQGLLRERLALRAAEFCPGFAVRTGLAGDLRGEVHLLRPGDLPGPAGHVCPHWLRAVERAVPVGALHRALPALPQVTPEQIADWLDAGQGAPVVRAATALEAVMSDSQRGESAALILADAVLARALGWKHLVPLLAAGLTRGDLRKCGDDLRLACHCAATASAVEAARLAADLARRVARLNAVAPKLRAKGAGEAVTQFLTRDALAPAALTALMSDRAARRLCDQLVELNEVSVHEGI